MKSLLALLARTACCLVACAALGAPEVTAIDMFDATNTSLANTTEFKTPVKPQLVIRRAQKYYFVITTNKEVPQANWSIFPSAKRMWDNTGVAILPGPGLPPFPDDDWYFKVSPGFVGFDSQEFLLEISIPKNAEIGEYEFRIDALVTIIPAAAPGRIPGLAVQKIFPKHVFILFNPWKSNDTVHMPDAKDRKEFIQNQDGLMRLAGSDKPWKYNQFDETTLNVLSYFLDQTPFLDRTDPIEVLREISGGTNWRDWSQGILEGRWASTWPVGTTKPWIWTGTGEILAKYTSVGPPYVPVKYGQCWVFSAVSTSLCRTAGIPAHPVSCFQTAIDNSAPPDGHVDVYFKWDGIDYQFDKVKSTDSQWNYHVWTEAWMKRPDIANGDGDGWQIIDATSQAKGPGLTRIGPAAREVIIYENAPPNASNYDAGFMWASAFSDIRVYLEDKIAAGTFALDRTLNLKDAKHCEHAWTKKLGAAALEDIVDEYLPFGPRTEPDPRSTGFTTSFYTNAQAPVGQDVIGTLTIANPGLTSFVLNVSFGADLLYYNGDLATGLADPPWLPVAIGPGQSVDLPLTIPAGALAPFIGGTQTFVRFYGAVHDPVTGQTEYLIGGSAQVTPPPVGLALAPPGPVLIGQGALAQATFTNTSGMLLTGLSATFSVGASLTMGGQDVVTYPLPDLAAGDAAFIPAQPFSGTALGSGIVSVAINSDQLPFTGAQASIGVVSCVGDFNGDGFVDDADFVLFASQYDVFDCASPQMDIDCPADPNTDLVVDDGDFLLFADAYSSYVCPGPPIR